MTIYIASDKKYKEKIKEDLFIQEYLVSRNNKSEILTLPEILNQVNENDTVILKSIWGYHINYEMFINQISSFEKKSVKLINDYKYIYWNIDKYSYLSELSQYAGFKLIPTRIIELRTCKNEEDVRSQIQKEVCSFQEVYSSDFVVKPNISASGYLTYKYKSLTDNQGYLTSLLENKHRKFIVQPFRKQITDGEISVIVLNGEVCYGIKRFPGVLVEKENPIFIEKEKINTAILGQIDLLLNFFSEKFKSLPNICRIDFVEIENDFEIMEIEMIDPDLFFKLLPQQELRKSLGLLCDT
jgi:hypothetical protein